MGGGIHEKWPKKYSVVYCDMGYFVFRFVKHEPPGSREGEAWGVQKVGKISKILRRLEMIRLKRRVRPG
jgi:hypothetical protein